MQIFVLNESLMELVDSWLLIKVEKDADIVGEIWS